MRDARDVQFLHSGVRGDAMRRRLLVLALGLMALLQLGATAGTGAEPEARAVWRDCDAAEYVAKVDALARLVYGEARGCDIEGQAAVVWLVLNRVEDPRFPDTVLEVVTQAGQFAGYKESYPVLPELVEIAEDVLTRCDAERGGVEDVGRVLPRQYLYFSGDGARNYFTTTYAGGDVWDWSARSPYREAGS